MATEFFRVHDLSERKNIYLDKHTCKILKYILHRYINSNKLTNEGK